MGPDETAKRVFRLTSKRALIFLNSSLDMVGTEYEQAGMIKRAKNSPKRRPTFACRTDFYVGASYGAGNFDERAMSPIFC